MGQVNSNPRPYSEARTFDDGTVERITFFGQLPAWSRHPNASLIITMAGLRFELQSVKWLIVRAREMRFRGSYEQIVASLNAASREIEKVIKEVHDVGQWTAEYIANITHRQKPPSQLQIQTWCSGWSLSISQLVWQHSLLAHEQDEFSDLWGVGVFKDVIEIPVYRPRTLAFPLPDDVIQNLNPDPLGHEWQLEEIKAVKEVQEQLMTPRHRDLTGRRLNASTDLAYTRTQILAWYAARNTDNYSKVFVRVPFRGENLAELEVEEGGRMFTNKHYADRKQIEERKRGEFKFVKYLGVGGHAIAMLYRMRTKGPDDEGIPLVVRWLAQKTGDYPKQRAIKAAIYFRGAKHIIQSLSPNDLARMYYDRSWKPPAVAGATGGMNWALPPSVLAAAKKPQKRGPQDDDGEDDDDDDDDGGEASHRAKRQKSQAPNTPSAAGKQATSSPRKMSPKDMIKKVAASVKAKFSPPKMDRFRDLGPMSIDVIEYAEAGDLHRLLVRMANQDTPLVIGNKSLWRLFACLVKACIAMAKPPGIQIGGAVGYEERIRNDGSVRQIVHHDIDYYNILSLDDTASPEHAGLPMLKLGDWDLMTDFDDTVERFEVRVRQNGKKTCQLPETHYAPLRDHTTTMRTASGYRYYSYLSSPHPLRANYGPWSNVFSMGAIMWCIATLSQYPYGNNAVWATSPRLNGRYATLAKFMHPESDNAGAIRDLDPDLKDVIQRCMAQQPQARPTLHELQEIVDQKFATEGSWGETDDETWTKWRDVLEGAFTQQEMNPDGYMTNIEPRDEDKAELDVLRLRYMRWRQLHPGHSAVRDCERKIQQATQRHADKMQHAETQKRESDQVDTDRLAALDPADSRTKALVERSLRQRQARFDEFKRNAEKEHQEELDALNQQLAAARNVIEADSARFRRRDFGVGSPRYWLTPTPPPPQRPPTVAAPAPGNAGQQPPVQGTGFGPGTGFGRGRNPAGAGQDPAGAGQNPTGAGPGSGPGGQRRFPLVPPPSGPKHPRITFLLPAGKGSSKQPGYKAYKLRQESIDLGDDEDDGPPPSPSPAPRAGSRYTRRGVPGPTPLRGVEAISSSPEAQSGGGGGGAAADPMGMHIDDPHSAAAVSDSMAMDIDDSDPAAAAVAAAPGASSAGGVPAIVVHPAVVIPGTPSGAGTSTSVIPATQYPGTSANIVPATQYPGASASGVPTAQHGVIPGTAPSAAAGPAAATMAAGTSASAIPATQYSANPATPASVIPATQYPAAPGSGAGTGSSGLSAPLAALLMSNPAPSPNSAPARQQAPTSQAGPAVPTQATAQPRSAPAITQAQAGGPLPSFLGLFGLGGAFGGGATGGPSTGGGGDGGDGGASHA